MRRLLSGLTVATLVAGLAGGLGVANAAAAQPVARERAATPTSAGAGSSAVKASTAAAPSPIFAGATLNKRLPKQVIRLGDGAGGASAQQNRRQPRVDLNDPITAKIDVTYTGFPAPARVAFQAAVDIWARTIHSSVEIDVQADWTNLSAIYGSDVLGASSPSDYMANFTDSSKAKPNVYYPIALANAITGHDHLPANACSAQNALNPAGAEVQASFNSDPSKPWYFGTDGNVDINHVDLETVVLHELGHGFGFDGTFDGLNPITREDDLRGYYGMSDGSRDLTIFDTFVTDGQRHGLTSSLYPYGSTALGAVLRGNLGGANWNGTNGKNAFSGNPVPLYSPYPWQEGSSFSHLDEDTFPGGNANALMTPVLAPGEAEHQVGPIVTGMFEDMGWPTAAVVPGVKGLYHPVAQGSTTDRLVHRVGARGGVPVDMQVVGKFGVPSYVTAVTVNVEIKSPTSSGFWAALPGCKAALGKPSSGYYTTGLSRSAQVTLPVGPGGRIQVTISAGTAEVNVDLVGWYFTSGDYYHHLQSQQVAATAKLSASKNLDVQVAGKAGVPTSGVSAVVLRAQVGGSTSAAYLRVAPGGVISPLSSLVFGKGETISNLITVPIGTGTHAGLIHLQVSTGTVNVTLAAVGYYGPSATNGKVFHPAGPARYPAALAGSDHSIGDLPNASQVLFTGHIVAATGNGTLSASPAGPGPMTAVQQYRVRTSVSGSGIATTNAVGQLRVRLSAGRANLYLDALGWFADD